MDKKKITLIAILAVVVAIVLYFLFFKKQPPSAIVQTEPVELGRVTNSVTATGKIEPVTEVEVGTQVSGKIDKIYVDYNSVVKKGQLLAELDRSTLLTSLNAAKTDYSTALNELHYYEKVYNRNKTLHDKSLISDSEFEEIEYQYVRVKNSVTKSKFEVDRATTNLGYATITSPINGVVLSVEVEEGQTVTASMTTPTLFVIAENLVDMQVVVNIDEADIGEVKQGQKVEFSVDAYPNDKFTGVVRQVRLEPTTTSNVVTYEVIVDTKNPDLKLKPGLTANISIFTMDKDSIVTIPNKALRFQMEESLLPPKMRAVHLPMDEVKGASTVWVIVSDSVAEQRIIQTGVSNGSRTEVISGLQLGEQLITNSVEVEGSMKMPQKGQGQGDNNPFMPKRPTGGKRR
ncbi:MAG: efflux RND transporter periplasmic adaptor subunit [Paludibacteraceae bacterium]|nr:efflux RND transporter periplasmic adaptor subunit [Paludibacteraceae bacterium]